MHISVGIGPRFCNNFAVGSGEALPDERRHPVEGDPDMNLERSGGPQPAIRTKMKGAIVKVLRKAKPEGRGGKRFPGRRGPGGYVRLAHTGIRKMFKGEPLVFGPRLDVAQPAPSAESVAARARLVALAMDRLFTASMRASFQGLPVTVTVDDEDTAAVFREVLEMTKVERPTDALIRIEVREP